ncbi:MAG: phosphate/phosphite/phosphonate ABC transporter substrate-binding protein [Campylobacterales bacterium]|nr:phosphate/phosphite/phosphonate ABC transporter substrate-binding protein [Campylobacterales bacterium]
MMGIAFLFSGCTSEENETKTYKPSAVLAQEGELIVGIHPYLNAQKTFLAYEPLFHYFEENLKGVHFRLETSLDYADYERKLYSGHFDVALPNPYQTLKAVEYGYRIVAKVKPDSEFRGIIVARKESHIRFVEQLRSKAISFPASTALAATMMPKLFLYEKGLNVDRDSSPRYVGSQYSSIMNAYSGDTVAAATWPSPWKTWQQENPDKAAQMEVIWETPILVNNGLVVRSNLDASTVQKIVESLCALDKHPKGRNLLKSTGFEGFERASEKSYLPVKQFLQRYEKTLGLPK